MTAQNDCVVKQAESYKDADYFYNEIGFGNFAFLESRKEEKVQVLSHEVDVVNYIESFTAIKGSDDYVDYIKAKLFTQYSNEKGLEEFPDESEQPIIKNEDTMTCCKVFGDVAYKLLTAQ